MRGRKILILFTAFLMVFLTVVQASGQSVDALKKQQEQIQNQIEQTKKEIANMQSQSKEIDNQIKEIDLKVANAASEIESVEKEIEIINLNIDNTMEELLTAEKNIEERLDTFNQRLRVMYKNGNTGYLEVLLSSGNIKDFLSRQEMIQSIAEYDKELIKYMKEQRDIIEEKKVEMEGQRASLEVTRSKLESRKRDLEKVSREKENLMGRLQQNIKSYESEYDKLNEFAKEIETKIVKLQRDSGPYSGGKMDWPVPGHSRISSPYGYRIHPIFKVKKLHTGVDIPAPTGTPITAAAAGTVIYSDWLGGYGKVVMLDHGGGIVTLYAHNSSVVVSEGQTVARGATVAKAGSTGNSTGPHLHFEVRKNGSYVDPIPWLRGN
ncbi:murein hydrolase activator EnvC family protein [Gudongella sp. DL1XJH-153]|uniref:murein hydrolase activator EnvC family protein n=1 Tax=Gudongella sp. DL1XJH-153 TaxID=3409804 RepID=UPI003BB7720E